MGGATGPNRAAGPRWACRGHTLDIPAEGTVEKLLEWADTRSQWDGTPTSGLSRPHARYPGSWPLSYASEPPNGRVWPPVQLDFGGYRRLNPTLGTKSRLGRHPLDLWVGQSLAISSRTISAPESLLLGSRTGHRVERQLESAHIVHDVDEDRADRRPSVCSRATMDWRCLPSPTRSGLSPMMR
jgi:hypothetical protein